MISNTSHIKMDTYHAQLQSAEFASSMMKLGCYLFMAIVGLIGFMNMANTMIMNITTKKQEYGILQAVGMTNKQLNLCLQLQGLMFTVGTICVALIIGLPLGYALFSYQKLISLRKENPVFVNGKFELLLPEDERIFAYTRTDEHTKMLACTNFTDEEVSCPLLDEWKAGEVWIRNYEDDREGNILRPYEAVIIAFTGK